MSEVAQIEMLIPDPTPEELRRAYTVGCRSRVMEQHMVRHVSRGEVKFSIWGPGEEVHGTATALAMSKLIQPERLGLVPHYRSGSLCAMWCELNGLDGFAGMVLRQQFSKATDTMTRGRQMVYHLDIADMGILPVQSPVGMQLGKAAGYARGVQVKGVQDSVCVGIVGDGTTAEGDMHDAMNAASVWSLPFIVMVTDNEIAISTTPHEGRGIKDFSAYAEGFGVRYFGCNGADFWDVYRTTYQCVKYVRDVQRPALLYVHSLPRLNAHSSAANYAFDLDQADPLIEFGQELVRLGVYAEEDTVRRIPGGTGQDFFAHHNLGNVMAQVNTEMAELFSQVKSEPDPDPATLSDHIMAPFPDVTEPAAPDRTTNITYGGAIRAALDHIVENKNGVIWGQDVARLGGVMQATAGLLDKHPGRITDTPLNEPLIIGTACGAGLHDDLVVLPEIQFGDYCLNAFHWFVHMGNTHWASAGNSNYSVVMRTPVDPFGGGAIYHSMSIDGYLTPIPGLVILMPSTSWDAYGLLMTAADYGGPVIVLEPKWMYRQYLGPAFPQEPVDKTEIAALRRYVMRGGIPDIDPDLRVPLGKAAIRRAGCDVTVVAWGRAVWTAMKAAEALSAQGVSAEVIDLRTLVPPDLDTIFASVEKTGRLVVASEDRPFAGFVRSIQGAVVERFANVPTRTVGQKNIPGIAQSSILENAAILTDQDIVEATKEVMSTQSSTGVQTPSEPQPSRGTTDKGWSWIPPRLFLS